MPDSRIDFSDIPESTEAELKRARRVGRAKTGEANYNVASCYSFICHQF